MHACKLASVPRELPEQYAPRQQAAVHAVRLKDLLARPPVQRLAPVLNHLGACIHEPGRGEGVRRVLNPSHQLSSHRSLFTPSQ